MEDQSVSTLNYILVFIIVVVILVVCAAYFKKGRGRDHNHPVFTHDTLNYILILTVVILIIVIFVKSHFMKDQRFYDDDKYEVFPQLKRLADNYEIIEKEYIAGGYSVYDWPEKSLLLKRSDEWKVVPLYGFGIWNKQYTEKFSETIKLLKEVPGLRSAIFSRLGPGTRLKKHQGWASLSNEVLRCHMGVVVPDPSLGRSGVEVEDEFRQVKKGDWIVFDDSKIHIGVNESNQTRTVLLLDIERPWWIKKGKSTVPDTPQLKLFISRFQ